MTLPKSPHREDIKAEIRKQGMTLHKLARIHQLGENALTICMVRPLPRANRVIADFLDLPLNHLWPQWYDASGDRILLRSTSKTSPKQRPSHSKKADPRIATGKAGAR